MPHADLGDVTLEYDRRGDPDGPSLLLVMGLGAQRTWWPEELLDGFVDAGLDVISFDNRDAGLSTWLDTPPPPIAQLAAAMTGHGERVAPSYTLPDLAADAVGLLDHLGIARAHVVGASMGGMIAQHLAFGHPGRVATLTSVMSNTGASDSGQPTPEAAAVLLAPPAADRASYVATSVRAGRVIGSNRWFDEEWTAQRAGEWYDRAYNPPGVVRQLHAILDDGDRTARLGRVTAPTLVLHGLDDTLIQPDGGRATAAAIPGAQLREVADMGHDLPLPLLADLVAGITDHVRAHARTDVTT